MPALYPSFDIPPIVNNAVGESNRQKSSIYFDFALGDFACNSSGSIVIATPYEAWCQWCMKTVYTQRFAFMGYSDQVGIEAAEAFNEESRNATESTLIRTIPDSIGKEENGWVSDMTLPTAIQKAEIVQYRLVEILKSIFPKYANYFLDEHAETRGMRRRTSEYAEGFLTVRGKANTIIPKGFLFSTASTLDASGVIFILDNETIISEIVKVISATDDSGLVTIIVTDLNGEPAGETICENIYNYIMRPDSPSERPAPINALLKVTPPILKRISVAADVTLESGYSIEGVIDTFVKNTREYLKSEDARWEVKYTEIGGLLIQTEGIADYDYQSLSLNGSKLNVAVGQNELPSIESAQVVLTQ